MVKSNYWQERFLKEEERRNKDARAYLKRIEKQYDMTLRDIEKDINDWYVRLAKNNEITLREAKMLLSKDELEEFHWTVEEYIEKGRENALSQEWIKQLENASAKVHISKLEALKVQIQNEIEGLYGERLKGMEEYLERIYGDTYYKTAFEIQKGIGIGWSLSSLDTDKINQVIHKPWAVDGKNFSERLWEDKTKLINTLHTGLTQNIIRGFAPDNLIRQISKEFGVKKSIAGRLVMTESAAYSSKAQEQCFKDLDVEKYEIIATLDTSTSTICREMDGKVFDMKDYQVGTTANPFHPNCRTCTAPYFEDDTSSMRAMRNEDGKLEYVPANMKYEEWYKKFIEQKPIKNGIILSKEEVYKKAFDIATKELKDIDFETWKKEYLNIKKRDFLMNILDEYSDNNIIPTVVSKEKFEILSQKYIPLYRGLKPTKDKSVKEMISELKKGIIYYGNGTYGNGIYFSPNKNIAENYSSSQTLIECILKEDAKWITYQKLVEIYEKDYVKIETSKNDKNKIVKEIFDNMGRYAKLKGYDVILLNNFQGNEHYIILNPEKMILKGED